MLEYQYAERIPIRAAEARPSRAPIIDTPHIKNVISNKLEYQIYARTGSCSTADTQSRGCGRHSGELFSARISC